MDKLRKFKLRKINDSWCKGCFEHFRLDKELLERDKGVKNRIYGTYWKSGKNYKIIHFSIDGELSVYDYFNHRHDAFGSFVKGSNINIDEGYLHKTGLFKVDNDILLGSYSSPLSTSLQHYSKIEGFIKGDILKCIYSYPERITFKIKIGTKGAKCIFYTETDSLFVNEIFQKLPVVKKENLI